MDVSGELELDVDHDLFKKRLSAAGKPLDDGEKHEVTVSWSMSMRLRASDRPTTIAL